MLLDGKRVAYDMLIVAAGARHAYFGRDGVAVANEWIPARTILWAAGAFLLQTSANGFQSMTRPARSCAAFSHPAAGDAIRWSRT